MTLAVQVVIKQDGEILHEDAVEYSEDQDGVWLAIQNWLVSAGKVGFMLFYGPPPQPRPKLPREAWDREYQ